MSDQYDVVIKVQVYSLFDLLPAWAQWLLVALSGVLAILCFFILGKL